MKIKTDIKRIEWQGRVFLMAPDAAKDQPPLVLNETADRLLHLLVKETSRAALLATLAAEYDMDEAVLATDLDDFLRQLRALNLLED